jgi:hypothetical protein
VYIIGSVGVLILLTFVCVVVVLMKDRAAPKIIYENKQLTYHEGDSTKELLQDVKAEDAVDGDVNASLTIESIHTLSGGNEADIIYAAKDNSNNVTKVNRIVRYVSKNPAEMVVHTDRDKVDISDKMKPSLNAVAGVKKGDQISNDNKNSAESPIIHLKEHKKTIMKGAKFNPLNYVAEALDNKDDAYRRIQVDGKYQTDAPGKYSLKFDCGFGWE